MNLRNALKTSLLVILINAGILSEPVVFAMQGDQPANNTQLQAYGPPGQYAKSFGLLQNPENVAELNQLQNPVNVPLNQQQNQYDPYGLKVVYDLDPKLFYYRGSLWKPFAWAGLAALSVVPGVAASSFFDHLEKKESVWQFAMIFPVTACVLTSLCTTVGSLDSLSSYLYLNAGYFRGRIMVDFDGLDNNKQLNVLLACGNHQRSKDRFLRRMLLLGACVSGGLAWKFYESSNPLSMYMTSVGLGLSIMTSSAVCPGFANNLLNIIGSGSSDKISKKIYKLLRWRLRTPSTKDCFIRLIDTIIEQKDLSSIQRYAAILRGFEQLEANGNSFSVENPVGEKGGNGSYYEARFQASNKFESGGNG